MAMIELRDVSKVYFPGSENEVRALDHINLEVEKGQFVAIVGQSGSGKSTCMNIIGCLDIPSSGQYIINGTDASHLSEDDLARLRNKTLGFIFQQYNLIPMISVYENIVLPLRLDGAEIDQEFFEELTGTLGLKEKLGQLPETLSGGQQQRAAIARALMTKPAIVLGDEPTGNLDSVTSMEVVGLLKNCAKKYHQTVILVTHQEEVAQMADRIIRIEDGRIAE